MGLKKFISQKDIDRAKNTKLPVAKNGKFQSVRGEGTTQSSRFPQLESRVCLAEQSKQQKMC